MSSILAHNPQLEDDCPSPRFLSASSSPLHRHLELYASPVMASSEVRFSWENSPGTPKSKPPCSSVDLLTNPSTVEEFEFCSSRFPDTEGLPLSPTPLSATSPFSQRSERAMAMASFFPSRTPPQLQLPPHLHPVNEQEPLETLAAAAATESQAHPLPPPPPLHRRSRSLAPLTTISKQSTPCATSTASPKRWSFRSMLQKKSDIEEGNYYSNSSNSSRNSTGGEEEDAKQKAPAKQKPPVSPRSPNRSYADHPPRKSGGGGGNLYALHYAAQRAQNEELRKKTFLPYKQSFLGCLGFSSKNYVKACTSTSTVANVFRHSISA